MNTEYDLFSKVVLSVLACAVLFWCPSQWPLHTTQTQTIKFRYKILRFLAGNGQKGLLKFLWSISCSSWYIHKNSRAVYTHVPIYYCWCWESKCLLCSDRIQFANLWNWEMCWRSAFSWHALPEIPASNCVSSPLYQHIIKSKYCCLDWRSIFWVNFVRYESVHKRNKFVHWVIIAKQSEWYYLR